jgi:hypothetical protein
MDSSGPVIPSFIVSGAGGSTLVSKGGTGTTGTGGAGANILIAGQSGSNVQVLGGALAADVGFTPKSFAPYLGTNPLTFVVPGPALLTPPLVSGAPATSTPIGNDGLTPATGLHVGPGVTLTIATNAPNSGLRTDIIMTFLHGVWIEGTVVVAHQDITTAGDAGSLSAANLSITAGENMSLGPASSVDTRGSAGTGPTPNGGNGGNVTLIADADALQEGGILSTGGDAFATSGTGGKGGAVGLFSGSFLFATGAVTTNGGMSPAGAGGNAGTIGLVGSANLGLPAETAGCFVSATLNARGGNGATGAGTGPTGVNPLISGTYGVIITNNQGGQIAGRTIFSGTIDASGGSTSTSGNGGAAAPGGVLILAQGGTLQAAGTILAKGGNSPVTGGAGGTVAFTQTLGEGSGALPGPGSPPVLLGGMTVSTSVNSSGGNGATGGGAGSIGITQALNGLAPGLNPLILAGYSSLDVSGNTGASGGGGASITLQNLIHTDQTGMVFTIGGILNEAALTAVGADGTAGGGGHGGGINLTTAKPVVPPVSPVPPGSTRDEGLKDRSVTNSGTLTASGGNGTTTGGGGGVVVFYDHFASKNTAPITATGGTGGTGSGGAGGFLFLRSDDSVDNSGPLVFDGGASTSAVGGTATAVRLANVRDDTGIFGTSFGATGSVINSGTISARGGNGGTFGGGGGFVLIYDHFLASNSGALTARGGTGGAAGAGNGGGGFSISVLGDEVAINTAPIDGSGGASLNGAGGSGGDFFLTAQTVSHSGNVTLAGGNGTSSGGSGGFAQVLSSFGASAVHGVFSVPPGTGGTGIPGTVNIDGVDQTLMNGSIAF